MRFGLLGELTAEDDDGVVRQVGTGKSAVLLAVLLLHANRVVRTETLKEVLWGDSPPATAAASFHNHLARVRRLVESDGGEPRLLAQATGYLLRVGEEELDATVFERRLRNARDARSRGDWETVGKETSAALELWRGTPLADVPLPDAERNQLIRRLEEARIQALQCFYDVELEFGRHREVVAELTERVEEHPLHEAFHGQLMLALYRGGRQADALQAYERLRTVLCEELGVGPGPELRSLHQRLLTLDPDLTVPASSAIVPPAAHEADGLLVPSQLPPAVRDFTGRAEEVQRVVDDLMSAADGSAVTVVVHRVAGGGGIGKTTLAVQAAHRSRDAFPDGQLFMDLRGTTTTPVSPESALARLLCMLGAGRDDVPAGVEGRSAAFRSLIADRRVLLVLDDAGDPAQVRPLLPGTAGSAVLITSRRRLDSLPGSRIDLGTLPDRDAYRLFASLVGEGRAAADPPATAEVLQACGGLPLALRIAGARLAARPAWPVAYLARRLSDQRQVLHELRAEDLHVRTALQVGYDLLQQDSTEGAGCARAFRLLGLSPGGAFGIGAAAALLGHGHEETEEWLERLVDAHLLDSPEPGRYQFHVLVKALAEELCLRTDPVPERRSALRRMVEWYLHGARQAAALLVPTARLVPMDEAGPAFGFATYDEARAWCATEQVNAVATVRLAYDCGFHDLTWKLAASLWGYHRLTAQWDDMLSTYRIGLDAARATGDGGAEGWMLIGVGNVAQRLGQPAESITYFEQALEAYRRADVEETRLAAVVNNLGNAYTDLGEHHYALDHYERALRVLEQAGAHDSTNAVLNNIGDSLRRLERYDEALAALDRGAAVQNAANDQYSLAIGLVLRGDVHLAAGRPEQAALAYEQAIAVREQIGDRHGIGVALLGLGDARAAQGDHTAARGCWERAVPLLESARDTARIREAGLRLRGGPGT